MKKIALIFNHFRHQDGVGRSALAIANNLSQLNLAEVTLIPIYTDEKDFHTLLDPKVKIKHVFGFYFHGMPHFVDKMPLSWINKRVFSSEYDIVVGFQSGLSIKCVASANFNNHVLKLAWMHGYDYGLTQRKEYEKIGKVVCVSKGNAERLHKELPTIEVDYNYNPIDEKSVQRSGKEPINLKKPSEGLLFVSVGRLSPEKGFGRLIKVLKRLKDNGYAFNLWLIGDGPLEQELHKLVDDLHMNEYVVFLGRQNNPHKFTSKADVFVCSSFSEGYSTACTEAIMLGVPVVSTNVSGAEEIIEDAGCGKVVGTSDDNLYDGLREVLDNTLVLNSWKEILKKTQARFYANTRIQRVINIFGL